MSKTASLNRFFVGVHAPTGVEFFLIPQASKFSQEEKGLANFIMTECDRVESQVWNKKFDIYHSTFALDYVILIYSQKKLIGFAAIGLVELQANSLAYYLSEIMILPEFQRRSIAAAALREFQKRILEDYPALSSLYAIVLSGHIALFRVYFNPALPEGNAWDALTGEERAKVMRYLERDIKGAAIDESGVLSQVWPKQSLQSGQVWPTELASRPLKNS